VWPGAVSGSELGKSDLHLARDAGTVLDSESELDGER